ncbi:MAG: acyl-CoA desaturase [Leptospirales bacterium]|nr:acyl-CoA desaturase [Leptospirales bacterium]
MSFSNLWNRFTGITLWKVKSGKIMVEHIPFILLHLSPLFVFTVPFSWDLVALAAGLYFVRMFFITGFYHRYFSHRGYEVRNRYVQFAMGLLGTTCVQQGPLWWAEHHRHHHRYSETEKDIHSPVQYGFWQSHMLWFLTMYQSPHYKRQELKDFAKYPELHWLDRYFVIGPVLLGVALFLIGGAPYLVWGLCVSTVVLWHGTWTINSLSHVFGNKRFTTEDDSRNNWLLAILTLGEGWHNNHHAFQGGAKAGFYWYEYDITYYGLCLMRGLGLITKMGAPPERILALGRENDRIKKTARGLVGARTLRKLSVEEAALLIAAADAKAPELARDRKYFRKLNLDELKRVLAQLQALSQTPAMSAG